MGEGTLKSNPPQAEIVSIYSNIEIWGAGFPRLCLPSVRSFRPSTERQKLCLYIRTLKFGVRGSLVYVYHVFDFSVHQLNGRSCIYIFEHWNFGCGDPAPRLENILVSLILWTELRIMTTRLSRLFLPGVESCWGLAFDPVSSFKLEFGGRGDCQQLKINFDHGNLGGAGGIGFCFQDTKKLSLSFPRWGSAIWHCL